jgi:hypothetical protein
MDSTSSHAKLSLTDWKLANRLLIPQELMLNRLAHHGRIELRGAGGNQAKRGRGSRRCGRRYDLPACRAGAQGKEMNDGERARTILIATLAGFIAYLLTAGLRAAITG